MLAVSIPTDRLSRIRAQVDAGLPNVQAVDEPGYSSGEGDTGSGGGAGSSKTLRNLAIGGGIALAAYLAYSLLLPPKRAAASAPVSGVRGGRKGKRRRRGGSLKGRKPTIYEALYQRLGREPTNDELRAEVNRIKREAYEDLATRGKLPYQRRRKRAAASAPVSGVRGGFGMILDYKGAPTTAKNKAKQIMARSLEAAWNWRENDEQAHRMTEREAAIIDDQIKKLDRRINKIVGRL